MSAVMRITGLSLQPQVSEEAIRAAEDTFRSAIQGDRAGGSAAGEERLDDEHEAVGDAGGESVGQVADGVRQPA